MTVEQKQYVEVALALPLHQTLTYLVDDQNNVTLGSRVLVPLGRRRVTGFVVGFSVEEKFDYKLRKIHSVLDEEPLFPESLLSFFKWTADYYHYPLGMVIKTAIPSGLNKQSITVIKKGPAWDTIDEILESSALQIPQELLKLGKNKQLSVTDSKTLLKKATTKKVLIELAEKNIIEIAEEVTEDQIKEKKEICYVVNEDKVNLNFIEPTITPEHYQFEEFKELLEEQLGEKIRLSEAKTLYFHRHFSASSGHREVPKADIVKVYTGSRKPLKRLIERGLIHETVRRVYRNPFGDELPFYPKVETLTDQQTTVLLKIKKALSTKQYCPFLLFGITGSGKTEVYLQAAEKTLAEGRDVIVLVPEIALATQLEAHFVSRFGDKVVLQHSGLKAAEKYDQYHLALTGQAQIVIGARSAVFAPLADPGLIIVDEEHDAGFKQDDSLRYNGRDLAVLRAKYNKATVILGSATPSVTSFANAKNGKYDLLVMDKRVGERTLPQVRIVDLGQGKNGKIGSDIFSNELKKTLDSTFKKRKQSILLLNRRGFSSIVICRDCGEIIQCKNCNVSLTLHKRSKKLVCHYCGFFLPESVSCRSCGSDKIVPVGFGTERIEEEVKKLLPEARVARLDSDTSADRVKFLRILKEMRSGNIDILIGTQMIAKGHHFPDVILVGAVFADGGMSMPDYRAAEKTFQLISQVTGRAGRGDHPGEVIIQTMRPNHYAITFAKEHDYEAFYDREMQIRENPAFPPYVRIIVFHLQGEVEKDVQKTCSNIGMLCRQQNRDNNLNISVLGPAPSPIDKIKNRYRWQVLIKSSNIESLHKLCSIVEQRKNELLIKKTKLIIDVDPDSLM